MSKTRIAYFDPLGVYPEIKDQLASKLPLVNLHWNPPNRPLRSIPILDVELVEETVVSESTPKHQMLGLSAAPYLKLIFVKCDDNETYRSSVRKIIREWLTNNVNSTRDPTEWIIIYYVPHSKQSTHRFKTSTFDKICTDFNRSKRDRCIQIRKEYPTDMEAMEIWSELMTKIKEGVLEAFSQRVDLYEDEVKKLEAKKNVMGWNFGTFFYMKEGLALSFENISLFEDALSLYDELEAAFSGMSRQKTVTFFSSVGFDFEQPPKSLLDMQQGSEMRHQIMSNSISLFDFHCYLFGRQACLLMMISQASSSQSIAATKVSELYLRLRTFITEMIGLLQSNRKNTLMIAEWTFNLVQEFLEITKQTPEGVEWRVSEGRGELKILAQKALKTVAASKGWVIHGTMDSIVLEEEDQYEIKNEVMAKALEAESKFYESYRAWTMDASAEFEMANRVRTVNRLACQLAMLDYQLGNYEAACKQLESIPTIYSRQGWDMISTSLLSVYVKCLVKLDKRDKILSNSIELLYQYKYLHPTEVQEVVGYIQDLCGETQLEIELDVLFNVQVESKIVSAEDCGTYQVTATVKSVLSSEFPLDTAVLTFVHVRDSTEKLELHCDNPTVNKDNTKLVFSTRTFMKGRFRLQNIAFTKKKLTLAQAFTADTTPCTLELFQSPLAFSTRLKSPKLYALPQRRFLLELNTVHEVEDVQITLKALTPGVRLTTGSCPAIVDGVEIEAAEVGPLTVRVEKFKKQARIEVPFHANFDTRKIVVKSTTSYTLNAQKFRHITAEELDVSLAVDVNVHDFFKSSKLLSKFSVSCKNPTEPVRLTYIDLAGTDHFKTATPYGTDEVAVAFPGGPLSYVFTIERLPGMEQAEDLRLSIVHRYVHEECVHIMWQMVENKLKETGLYQYSLLVEPIVRNMPVDLKTFALEGWFKVPEAGLNRVAQAQELAYIYPQDRPHIINAMVSALDSEFTANGHSMDAITHDLVIPVSVPQVHVIHGIHFQLPSKDHFVIGQVISVNMSINSVRTWAPEDQYQNKELVFYYEISAAQDCWALTGKKKSQFVAKPGAQSSFKTSISMVPLVTGKLQLPKVDIMFGQPNPDLKMELDLRNGGETVLVVPGFDRMTLNW